VTKLVAMSALRVWNFTTETFPPVLINNSKLFYIIAYASPIQKLDLMYKRWK